MHACTIIIYSLACAVDGLAAVVTVEKLSVEQLNCNYRKDEMKQYVHNKYVDHVLQRIDHAVEHSFELGHALYGLQRSQYSQHAKRLDGRQVRADGTATVTKTSRRIRLGQYFTIRRWDHSSWIKFHNCRFK